VQSNTPLFPPDPQPYYHATFTATQTTQLDTPFNIGGELSDGESQQRFDWPKKSAIADTP
jgi:hypothetical protein